MQPIRQIETSKAEDPKASPLQNQDTLDDSNLKDISQQESDKKPEISAPVGPVTRSMVAGGGKLLSNCVQVATDVLHPLGELIGKPWRWWHSAAVDTE